MKRIAGLFAVAFLLIGMAAEASAQQNMGTPRKCGGMGCTIPGSRAPGMSVQGQPQAGAVASGPPASSQPGTRRQPHRLAKRKTR
jgi:hypothetical protein